MTEIVAINGVPSFDSPTLQGFEYDPRNPNRIGGSSRRQMVRFFNETVMEVQSTEVKTLLDKTGQFVESTKILKREAVPVTREMVEIVTPGDKNIIVDRAQPFHKLEHMDSYMNFREGKTAPIGTPIDECRFISGPLALELKVHRVHTVEQLADASDEFCKLIPTGWELREFARAEVKAVRESARGGEILSLKSQLSESKQTIDELKLQMSKLVDQFGQPALQTQQQEPVIRRRRRRVAQQLETQDLPEGQE